MAGGECEGAPLGSLGNEVGAALLQSKLWNKAINSQCPAVKELLLENMHNLNRLSLNLQRVDLYDEHALSSKSLHVSTPVSVLLLLPLKTADEAGVAGWKGGVRGGGVKLSLITLRGTEEAQRMDHSNCGRTTTATQPFWRSDGEMINRGAGNFYPIFFVSLQSAVQKVSRHLLIFIQPLNDKWLKPPMESMIYVLMTNWGHENTQGQDVTEALLTQDILALCS